MCSLFYQAFTDNLPVKNCTQGLPIVCLISQLPSKHRTYQLIQTNTHFHYLRPKMGMRFILTGITPHIFHAMYLPDEPVPSIVPPCSHRNHQTHSNYQRHLELM